MSAADIVLARREQHSSVVLPGWSREMLCRSRQCLQALMGLGVVVACDSKDGLVVQFEEAAAITCLMVPPEHAHEGGEPVRPSRTLGIPAGAKQLTQFGEALASMMHSDGSPSISFAPPGKATALQCMSAQILSHVSHPRDRHHVLIQYNARKLLVFIDYLNVIDVLEARLRCGRKEHLQTCDPVLRSEAWPKLQQSLRNQKLLEEQVSQRKEQLLKMEQASDDPDQIAHIRLLLDDVAGAEEEQEQNRQWLAKQEPIWIEEEKGFQQARWRQDLVCRERLAAILLELQYRLKQRGELHAELSRMEKLLLDFEETFSTTRQQLHEYDQELTAKIHDKEDLLLNLTQVLTSVKGQVLQAEGAAAKKSGELEFMHRIRELHSSKAQLPDEIDMLEKKLAALRAKNGPAPNRA